MTYYRVGIYMWVQAITDFTFATCMETSHKHIAATSIHIPSEMGTNGKSCY